MLGNRGLRKIECGDDIADGALIRGEKCQNVAAAGFGHGVESVGGCGSASHTKIIFLYRNMSSEIFAVIKKVGVTVISKLMEESSSTAANDVK
jgi:hypothetical protein